MSVVAAEAAAFTLAHFRAWASELVLDNGEPWILEPFQEAFVGDFLAGQWDEERPEDYVPEFWLVLPEGNGKSTLVAGIALYHAQFTPEAWATIAASSRDQSRIIYRQAKGFVLRSPALSGFRCYDGYRRIDRRENGAQIEVFAADERTGDGVIPTLAMLDELHRHRGLGLYRIWGGKLEKRHGNMLVISTAGEPGGEFEEARERIRQGAAAIEREETFIRAISSEIILHEWAVPENGNVEDIDLVARANPLESVSAEVLRRKFAKPTMTLGHWRRFVCNLPTRGIQAAIQEGEWHKAYTDERIPPGEPVWIGLDPGYKHDTTAAVPLWWRDEHFRLLGASKVLVPPRDGSSLDPHLVEQALIEIHQANPIEVVVMDTTSGGPQLAFWISAEFGATVIDQPQSLPRAVEEYEAFMEALRNGWLRHTGDIELRRHVLNAVAKMLPRGDSMFDRPSRTRQGGDQDRRVIDALKAAAMVHWAAANIDETPQHVAFGF